MIVIDLETSGLDYLKSGIWQIGAVEIENPENVFLEEARIDDEDIVNKESLKIIGKTEEELRSSLKQSQKQLIERFYLWARKIKNKDPICQNPQFDMGFLETKSKKYGIIPPFYHRSYDVHSIAQLRYFQIKGKFFNKENRSDMGLSNVLEFVGMKDERTIHNALEDSKLTAECFFRLVYGKNLLKEFIKFEIPDYLKI